MLNKKNIILLFTIWFATLGAQRHELGVRMGMSNLVGDIGRTNYILQKPFSKSISEHGIPFYGGIIYRMNFNPYQSLRFDLGYSHVQFNDRYAKETYRKNRGLSGTNSGAEVDVLFEYNFFPVNNEQKSMLSPYIFGGLGGLFYSVNRVTFVNDFNRDTAGTAQMPTTDDDFVTTVETANATKMVMSVPFGVGLKYKFNYNWAISGEIMFRPTFSDALDYSVIDDKDTRLTYNRDILQEGSNRSLLQQQPYVSVARERADAYLEQRNVGNPNSKDWINSITLSLTYSFGRPPCYCE
ncbi:MAG: DUF6089 family protein [Cruoricaptor ignavus]|nr:DUF6089 family protein [Cruoricaptor ignavus]